MTERAPDRLDAALAERGLARSRSHAATLIASGVVTVDGRPVVKPSLRVAPTTVLEVAQADRWVGRGALKLVAALDAFEVPTAGAVALDAGASTGGFTQVLLERGAAVVIALDVGHGQLAPTIASDPRVVSVEGVNARDLDADALAAASGIRERPTVVTADLSFIPLALVLPALVRTAAQEAHFVLLIKPQFEVGRTGVREGIVASADLRDDAISGVLWAGWDAGLGVHGLIASPIAGGKGNREYLAHLGASGSHPTEWRETSSRLAGA